MYLFRLGDKAYKVKFGYGVLYRSNLIDRVMNATNTEQAKPSDVIKNMIGLTAELLLEGLQKKHSDEFGYETPEERETMLLKVCDMLDEYEDEHEDDGLDGFSLYNDLNAELERNGFLSRITQAAAETAAEAEATVIPEDHQTKRKSKAGQKQ